MSINITGAPLIQPMSPISAPKTEQPLPFIETATPLQQVNKKINTGIAVMTGSSILVVTALLIQTLAQKVFPKLENKFPFIHVGVGLTGLAGMIFAATKMVIPAFNQLGEMNKSQASNINNTANGVTLA